MKNTFPQQLSAVTEPIETTLTLPPACYADSTIADLEKNSVFLQSWIGLGRSDQWKASGDYSVIELLGASIILIRDRSNRLHAFANSCSHRSSLILEGSGNVRSISCPFHRWTYSLEGELQGAPEMPGEDRFKKSQHGLTEFRVAERDGFTFISLNDDIDDIDTWLGDFSSLHAPWALKELITKRRLEIEVDCNWKCFLEVFNEYYHLPYVHPTTVDGVYNRPDMPECVKGQFASQFSTTEGTGGLLEESQQYALPPMKSLKGRNRNGTRYTWLFPNMTFAASTEAIWVYEANPINSEKCKVVMSVCFPPETIEHGEFEKRAKVYYDRMDAALAEDVPALVRQQKGLSSPYARQGQFCSELEPNVANFAIWYARSLETVLKTEGHIL